MASQFAIVKGMNSNAALVLIIPPDAPPYLHPAANWADVKTLVGDPVVETLNLDLVNVPTAAVYSADAEQRNYCATYTCDAAMSTDLLSVALLTGTVAVVSFDPNVTNEDVIVTVPQTLVTAAETTWNDQST